MVDQGNIAGALSLSSIDHETFGRFARLIYDNAGIKLGPHKEALVSARVSKRMRLLGIPCFREYYDYVSKDETGGELVELLNVISTNVTQFFREQTHFEFMGKIIREWAEAGQTRFRIWSAAASSGEEPYSIAITFRENLPEVRDVKILATDISTKVLNAGKRGVYSDKHMEHVPERCMKYFTRVNAPEEARRGRRSVAADERYFEVAGALKQMMTFARLNLSTPPFPMRGPLDIVFCRNVMIYFDNEVRSRLLQEIYRLVRPGGYLLVGHAESLSGMLSSFKNVQPSVYIKK